MRRYPVRRRVTVLAIATLLTLVLSPLAAGAQQPPGPTIRHQFRTAGLPASGPMEVVTFVLEFAPGAATPPHTHPGLLLATVLEGEITFSHGGAETVYRPGDSLIERPTEVGLARNTGGGRTRVQVSLVAPKGAPPSAPQPGGPTPAPPAPTALYLYRADAVIPAGPYEVAQAVLDFAPGAQTPLHTHPGQVAVTVLEGELTFRSQGTATPYTVGESFVEPPNVPGQATNLTAGRTTVLATYLLPQGAALSTPVQGVPGMPNTGGGGLRRPAPALWLLALGGGGLLAGGWLLRLRSITRRG